MLSSSMEIIGGMMADSMRSVPRLEQLTVENYRALKHLTLKLTPFTCLLGPNGSGKSTFFDVFAFLSECFNENLRRAWDRRGRFKELKTRGQEGAIIIELKYREGPKTRGNPHPLITYHIEIDGDDKKPFVKKEWLGWTRGVGKQGSPFRVLDFKDGEGVVIPEEDINLKKERVPESLADKEFLAVNTYGQLKKHPRVKALRDFITGWYLSYITANNIRTIPEAGPQERLSSNGENLTNVLQYLKEQHPQRLESILRTLRNRIPRLESVDMKILDDGRLLLQIKDAPFERPILSKYASDGTLKMLAYLVVLYDPDPAQLISIEEPENHLHPKLLIELAEECRAVSKKSQIIVTTHSPFFVNGMDPKELWILQRNEEGFTEATNAGSIKDIEFFVKNDAKLGDLWMEGHLGVGDPYEIL